MSTSKRFSALTLLWKAWLIAGLVGLVGVTVALAASGDLDPTFHGTGKYKLNVVAGQSNRINAIAVRSDGKIVALAETRPSSTDYNIAILRLTDTGALDTTFNSTGKKVTNLGSIDVGVGLAVDPANNKMIVAGQKCNTAYTICDLIVLRYNEDGSFDTSFNGSGKRIDDFGGDDNGSFGALALQSDGKIVVAGYMYNKAAKNYDFAVHRYTSGGALDTSFAGTGKKAIPFTSGSQDFVAALAVQPADGKIVLAGWTCNNNFANCNFALARLNPNGTLDTSFSGDGKQITDFGGSEYAHGVALQANGKILVAGEKDISSTAYNIALARYNPNGGLDSTFAGTGKKVFDFSGANNSWASEIAFQPGSGKIVVCGGAAGNFALARLTSTGALDTTFHGTGKVTVDFGGLDSCRALVTQPADGKYLMGGLSNDGTLNHSALARVLP